MKKQRKMLKGYNNGAQSVAIHNNPGIYLVEDYGFTPLYLLDIQVFFFTGIPSPSEPYNPQIMRDLLTEAELYGDIVQFDIVDTYKNITQKILSIYQYISELCPTNRAPKYFMKADDDILINLPAFYQIIEDIPKKLVDAETRRMKQNMFLIGGAYSKGRIIRASQAIEAIPLYQDADAIPFYKAEKWALPEWFFPGERYDFDYLMGAGYIQTLDAIREILKVLKCLERVLSIDDLFLTGFLPAKIKIPVINDDRFVKQDIPYLLENKRTSYEPFLQIEEVGIIPDLDPNDLAEVWRYLISKRKEKT